MATSFIAGAKAHVIGATVASPAYKYYVASVSGQSPFCNFIHTHRADRARLLLMSVFVAPIRLLLVGVAMVAAYIVAILTMVNVDVHKEDEPMTRAHRLVESLATTFRLRRLGRDLTATLVVVAHFLAGFYRVSIKGRRATGREAPVLILAPHQSFFDALPFCLLGAPSIVAKRQVINAPLVGRMIGLTAPIYVDRDCATSRKQTIDRIRQRARDIQNDQEKYYAQVAIFPEATTTNGRALLQFKIGGFLPGVPVQPVVIRWLDNEPDCVSYTYDGARS